MKPDGLGGIPPLVWMPPPTLQRPGTPQPGRVPRCAADLKYKKSMFCFLIFAQIFLNYDSGAIPPSLTLNNPTPGEGIFLPSHPSPMAYAKHAPDLASLLLKERWTLSRGEAYPFPKT